MAQKLSVQIELEGGAEIERQLEGIGEAGKKAFVDIAKSAEQVGGFKNIKPDEVTAKLKDMGVTGVDAIDKIKAAVQKAGKLEDLVQGIKTVEGALSILARAAPVAGAAIVAAMAAAAKATIAFAESVNKVNDQAIKLGAGVEQVDRFRAGLEQAGVSAESVGQILQSKLASEQGIQGLEAFIQSLERMSDSAARSKAAVERFGPAGAELIRILQAGGRLTGFGGTQGLINPADAEKATRLTQAINQLEAAYNRLNTLSFAPALTTGIDAVTSAVQVLGARLQSTPWTTFFNAANLGLNPIASLISTINGALTFLGGTVQQTGQQVQGGVQIWTQWGTAASQAGQQATVAVQGGGTAAQTTGQQVQEGVQIWTQWGTAATQAGGTATKAVDGAAQAASKPIPTTSWTDWANSAAAAVDTIINKLRELLGLQQRAAAAPAPAPAKAGSTRGMAGGGLMGGRGTGTSDSNLAWLSRGEYIMPARAVSQPGVLSFLEALRRGGRLPGFASGGLIPSYQGGGTSEVSGALSSFFAAIEKAIGALGNMASSAQSILDGTTKGLMDVIKATANVADAFKTPMTKLVEDLKFQMQYLAVVAGKTQQVTGHARGGLLGGRGTGTSDSNLAWLSRGEHIMPARAVAQPGVLAFLEALRRSGGNLNRVLDGMGRFALGGMVPRAIPAFAGGGNNVTIQFPGLPAIGGLRASSDVVGQLQKAAALAQVRSGGRKPSRYS